MERISNDPKLKSEQLAFKNETIKLVQAQTPDSNKDDFEKQLRAIRSKRKEFYRKVKTLREGDDAQFRDLDGPAIDLLEIAFWCWLSRNYPIHWQIIYTDDFGISGWGGSSIYQAENAEEKPKIVRTGELQEILKHNIFQFDGGVFLKLALPKDTTIKAIERRHGKSVFEIKTGNLTLKVTINETGGSSLKGTKLGDKIISESPNAPQGIVHFRVNFETKLYRFKIFSKETERQLKWVKELQQNFYNDFDWSVIKPDLEKAYLQ